MLKKLSFVLLLLLIGAAGYPQQANAVLPQITTNDLAEKIHPQDSTAAAAYLYRRGKTYYTLNNGSSWIMVTEVYTRIKVYKKEGYEYADASIMYYSGSKKGKGHFSEANTYNLVNGTIEKTSLKSDGEFEDSPQEDYTRKRITLPNVREGSIIEYKYTIETPHISYLKDWYFQYDIPVNNITYDVFIPLWFSYNVYILGYADVEVAPQKIVYNDKRESGDKYYHYSAKNVKAFKDEAFVNNPENYISTLKHELASVQFLGMPPQLFTTDWKTVAQKIYEHDNFGPELRHTAYFDDAVDSVTAGIANEAEKATAIFNFVRGRMAWNEHPGYLCDKGVKRAYAARVGNTAEINLMLTAMLRCAGLDANPVLVSTRSNGIAVYPTFYAYNYVIAAVTLNGTAMLMDATSKYSQPGILPVRVLNWQGRLIKKNGDNEEIDLMPKIISREVINIIADLGADGIVKGKARDQYFDYNGYVYREIFSGSKKEDYVEKLQLLHKGITIEDYKISNEKEPEKPFQEDYSFSHSLMADVIGSNIYFSPMLFFAEEENPFKQETREYPVDFVFPQQNRFLVSVKIPEGYVVESLPKPVMLAMEENIGSFKYDISAAGSQIQLSATLCLNYHTVSQEYYRTLKDFFQKMIEKQNEKVVLKKAS